MRNSEVLETLDIQTNQIVIGSSRLYLALLDSIIIFISQWKKSLYFVSFNLEMSCSLSVLYLYNVAGVCKHCQCKVRIVVSTC
jgi:hypothetical protein